MKHLKTLSIITVCAAAATLTAQSGNVKKMWYAGKPDPNKEAAGFQKINGIVHSPVFLADESRGGYNHHARITFYKGKFFATWSNQRYGEDGPGQRVLFAMSDDGKTWSKPKTLFNSPVPEAPWGYKGVHLAAKYWTHCNGKLYGRAWCGGTIAYRNFDGTEKVEKRDRQHEFAVFKYYGDLYREVKPDGTLGPVFSFMKEQPEGLLYKVADGKKTVPGFNHEEPKDYGKDRVDRHLCEATAYKAKDGKHVVFFRDGKYSHRLYVSFSDDGSKWTVPVPTDIPDSPSASRTLSLDDGNVLLVGNQMAPKFDNPDKRHYGRDPLMVAVSPDGYKYTRAYAVRCGKQKYTIPRKAVRGRGGGGQYPDIVVVGDKAYIIYSMGKEDIWVSSFKLKNIGIKVK